MKRQKFFLSAILALLMAVAAYPAALTETINKEFPFQKGNRLVVENVNGKILVEQWDKEIVKIDVVKTAKASSDDTAKEAMAETKIDFQTTSTGVTARVTNPKSSSFFSWLWGMNSSVDVNFKIMVPESAKLELGSVNGTINVKVKDASVKAETVNGEIMVTEASLLTAATVNGTITFESENITQVESVNGTISGALKSEKPRGAAVEAVNGTISIKLSEKAAVSLSMENVNGSILCDFKEVEGSKREKSGDLNGGGETISIETVNGTIEVTKL